MVSLMRRSRAVVPLAVVSILALAGCGSSDSGGSASTPIAAPSSVSSAPSSSAGEPKSSTSGDTTAAPREESGVEAILIRLADGKVTPNGEKMNVAKGTRVTLQITSDHDDTIHVHGFDVEKEVKAGEPATLTFTADQVGSFEVESHEPAKVILILNVR